MRRLIRTGILPAQQVCTGARRATVAADLEPPRGGRVVAARSDCRSVTDADPNHQGEFEL